MIVFKALGTGLLSIVTLFIMSKLIGNKQIAQMNMFDYINGITIGSIAADLATAETKKDLVTTFFAMVAYAFLVAFMSYLTIKSVKMRRLITGKALILIENGNIYRQNLKKAKLDLNDVMTLARNQGIFNISEISYAIMENNGKISFQQKAMYRPACPSDMNLSVEDEGLISTVILDGKLLSQNMRYTGLTEKWLMKNMKTQGYSDYSEIMVATIDSKHNLSIYAMNDSKYDKNIFD